MKGKLHKMESGYILSLNGDIDDPYAIVNKELAEDYGWYKLSLKNCQAIERGYDLDELACNEIRIDISAVKHIDEKLKENSSPCTPSKEGGCVGSNLYNQVKGFEKGFQKALEILGDKKFSEEDVRKIVTHVLNELVLVEGFDKKYLFPESIYQETTSKCKSLQQTEWDVEIEMEKKEYIWSPPGEGFEYQTYRDWREVPKLDANGYLILKRIK